MLIRQIPWTEQPQEAVPLLPELWPVWCVLGGSPDVVSGTAGAITGSSLTITEIDGLARQLATTGGGTNKVTYQSGINLSSPFTLIVRCRRNAASSSSSDVIFNTNTSDTTNSSLSIKLRGGGAAANSPFATVRTSGGTQYQAITSLAGFELSTTVYETLAVVHTGAALTLYKSGTQVGTVAATGFPGVMAQPITLGTQGSESKCAPVTVSFAALLRVPLSLSQIQLLNANPWGLLAPRVHRLWAPISGAGYTITADSGSYSITGQNASVYRNKVLNAAQGSYSITGQNATITYTPSGTNYTITANYGSYPISGQASSILKSKVLVAANGTYSLTGQSATVSYSGTNTITLKAGSWIRYRVIT